MILEPDELDAKALAIEAAVDATPGIDHWCSGPDWVLPVRVGFAPEAEPLAFHANGGFALLARYATEDGVMVLAGFEPLWGFACPLVGSDPAALATALASHLATDRRWSRLILPGFPTDLMLARSVASPLSMLGSVGASPGITRLVTAVQDFDQWLAARSRSFRRNLRQAERRAADADVEYLDVSNEPDLMDRLLSIEHRSWKGKNDDGIASASMTIFYRAMIARLQRADRCRAVVARLDGSDIGFILGGERGGRYRGLQLSYVEEVRQLSIGHLLQLHEMRRVCADPSVAWYDLGMEMDYKRQWAAQTEGSVALVVERNQPG